MLAIGSGGVVREIWVAAGTYRPSAQSDPEDPRSATFQLIHGVAIYGGFAGTESERDERDPATPITVLSGDLNNDDGPHFSKMGDNVYHVVTACSCDATTILDGVTITAGRAVKGSCSSGPECHGAGMYNSDGGPTLQTCTWDSNSAGCDGGGLANDCESEPTLANCIFRGNQAVWDGGAVCNSGSTRAVLTNCTITGNSSSHYGGGIPNTWDADAILTNCILWGNTAPAGGLQTAVRYDQYASP